MKWENAELSLIAEIGDGAHASLKRVKSGIPYLTAKNITKNGISYSNIDFISEETYEKYFKEKSNALTKPQKNDILYSIIGSIGGVYCVKDEKIGISSSVAVIRANSELIFPQYLAYFLKSKFFEAQVQAIKGGVAQGFMSIEKLKNVNILYPKNLDYQAKIVSILSAYDDLIESKQKQIKLLEEAAQRLYKEWFVDLRFPGYENAPIIDGVPEGWSMVKVGEVIKYEIGGGWGEETIDEKFDNPAYVIRGTDLYGLTHGDFNDIPYRFHSDSNLKARKLIDGDIIFEISGGSKNEGVARTALIRSNLLKIFSEPVMCASFCKLVRFDSLEIAQYMYDTFKYLRECGKTSEFDKKSASSIVNYRWKDFLMQQLILLPNEKILTNYNRLAINLYNQILCKSILIAKLVEARDKLLPKLMSGEIEV